MASQAARLMDEHDEGQKPLEETPDTRFSVGATAWLSNTPDRETVEGETQGQEEAGTKVQVNIVVAGLGVEPHTLCNLVGAEVINTGSTGLQAPEELKRGSGEGVETGGTEGAGEEQEEGESREQEVKDMSFPNSQGAMVDEDDEVEVVEDDQDIQIIDMSMEDSHTHLRKQEQMLNRHRRHRNHQHQVPWASVEMNFMRPVRKQR